MQLVYDNTKVQRQCTDLKMAKKLFGGNDLMARSLFARINALQQANVLKDIVVMPTFHFHKLNGNMEGLFAIDVKTRRDPWRIVLQPLDENKEINQSHRVRRWRTRFFLFKKVNVVDVVKS